jgi:hypothetical protein
MHKNVQVAMMLFRKGFSALQAEIAIAKEIWGFKIPANLIADVAVMERMESYIQRDLDLGDKKPNPTRIESGAQECLRITRSIERVQVAFLASAGPTAIKGRLKALDERQASFYSEHLKKYLELAKSLKARDEGATLLEVRDAFGALHRKVENAISTNAQSRIALVATPAPSTPRPDRKRDNRLYNKELRARMKGKSGGGGVRKHA